MACETFRTELCVVQGATWSQSWMITNYDFGAESWEPYSQVRRRHADADVLHDFDTVFDPLTGVVSVSVEPATSTGWVWNRGVYDIELHGDGGTVLRVVQGDVKVSPEVTRDE